MSAYARFRILPAYSFAPSPAVSEVPEDVVVSTIDLLLYLLCMLSIFEIAVRQNVRYEAARSCPKKTMFILPPTCSAAGPPINLIERVLANPPAALRRRILPAPYLSQRT
jgi:hypothetical protein